MSVSAPSSTSGFQNDPASGLTSSRENRLGQDAFLKLLTTQLANQDPLAPQENGEFLAQLATFSTLEKLTSIETSIKEMNAAFQQILGDPPASDDASGSDTSTSGTSNTNGQ